MRLFPARQRQQLAGRMAYLALTATTLLLTGCVSNDDGRVYDHYENTTLEGWGHNDTLHFHIPPHKKGQYLLEVGLRTTTAFPYQDICLIMERRVFPGGKSMVDTVRCKIYEDNGIVNGKRGVSNNELLFPVKKLNLNDKDSLDITLRHGMNIEMLPGITDVGVSLRLCEPQSFLLHRCGER